MPAPKQMPLIESLQTLHAVREDEIVITAMGTAREWMTFAPHPLDFVFVPSSMGQASALGLGMALARPDRRVIACNGDGSTLMNLGSLVSITAEAPENLTLLLFDNGVYEVTGSQATPGAPANRKEGGQIDFVAMARACGFTSVYAFDELAEWQAEVRNVIDAPGPTFAHIQVAPRRNAGGPKSPGPGKDRALRFIQTLKDS